MMFLLVFHFSLAVLLSSSETWLMRLEFRLEFLETSHIDSSGFIYSWNKLTNYCINNLSWVHRSRREGSLLLNPRSTLFESSNFETFWSLFSDWKLKIRRDSYGFIFRINIYILEKQVFKERERSAWILSLCAAFWSFPGATRSGPKCPAID